MVSPEIATLAAALAQMAVKNTASAISTKIQAFRTRKDNDAVISELIELVNELIGEKAQLVGIAQAFEQELAGQQITDEEIGYITEKLIPTFESLMAESSEDVSEIQKNTDLIKNFVSKETMTILQLVGFNFRQAIGVPLTQLVERLITSQFSGQATEESQVLDAQRDLLMLQIIQDPEASQRLADWRNN